MGHFLTTYFRLLFAVAARFLVFALPVFGQTASLVLDSGTAASDGTATLNLRLTSLPGSEPAALQWNFSYASNVRSISATAGSAATLAGKSLTCSSAAGSYSCLLTGMNANAITIGTVAVISVNLSPSVGGAWIGMTGMAASASGDPIPMATVGGTITGGLTGVAPSVGVSALQCNPTTVTSGAVTSCTVTLSTAAPAGGTTVTLSADNSALITPGLVTVAPGSTTATFVTIVGSVTTIQTAVLTATANGGSKPVALTLLGSAPTTSSSIWNPSAAPRTMFDNTLPVELGLKFQSSVAGFITGVRFYKGPQSTGLHIGHLWSKSGALLATTTFTNETASGWQQANFLLPVAISANNTYVISYYLTQGQFADDVSYFEDSGVTNGVLTALRDGVDGGNSVYQYGQSGFPSSTWESSNYWVDVVFSPNNTASPKSFISAAESIDIGEPTGTKDGASFSCSPNTVNAGSSFTCEVNSVVPITADVEITPSSTDLRMPASISPRVDQHSFAFRGYVDERAPQGSVIISAMVNGQLIESTISILAGNSPIIHLPEHQLAKLGSPVAFIVSAKDPSDQPVDLSVSGLPAGASFDPRLGRFQWTPTELQNGTYRLTFTATNRAHVSSAKQLRVDAGSGIPMVSNSSPAVPGSVVRLSGRWLGPVVATSDLAGSSLEVAGTKVKVNGVYVPVLSASQREITFLCPDGQPGDTLEIVAETPAGSAQAVQANLQEAYPAVLSTYHTGTTNLVTVRDVRGDGYPAQPGDLVTMRVTGLGNQLPFLVRIGDVPAAVRSVTSVFRNAGTWDVQVEVPSSVPYGDTVPVQIQSTLSTGKAVESRLASLAIEALRR